jgi:hypothetical protein
MHYFFPVIFIKYLCSESITYFFLSLRLKSLFFRARICPNCGPTTCIPFGMYVVISMYSKSNRMFSRLTAPAKGGMYSKKTDMIYFVLSRSFQCLLRFSTVWPECRLVDGDACNLPVDDACIPIDMTLSVISFTSISSIDFSNSLRSLSIHTCNQITRVGEQTSKILKWMAGSRNHKAICNQFSISSDISVCKKWSSHNV